MVNHPKRRKGYKKGPTGYGITIAPPPANLTVDDDRDGHAGEMMDAALDVILIETERLGWHPAEIVTAVMGWAVHTTYERGNREAAIELIDAARELIDLKGAKIDPR